jgi:hypothetical protein
MSEHSEQFLFSDKRFDVLSSPIQIDAQSNLCAVLQLSNFEFMISNSFWRDLQAG